MDLNYTPEEESFRAEVRAFLQAELPADIRDRMRSGRRVRKDDIVRWQKILHRRGWGAGMWPERFGGAGWSVVEQHIFEEEAAAAGAPPQLAFSLRMVAPVLMTFANAAQQDYFLPRIISGEDWWCQGYSEPGSGSDLASLRTSAVRQGDHYLVNGQKTWNTLRAACRLDLLSGAHQQRSASPAGHFVFTDRHEDAGRHRTSHHHARRRARDQRHLLRQREGPGAKPGRRREQGLDLRKVPALSRAHQQCRHRPLQARIEAAQGHCRRANGERPAAASRIAAFGIASPRSSSS